MKTKSLSNFDALVEFYYQPLFSLAVSLCGRPESALALTQQTFCVAAQKPNRFRHHAHIKPWLFGILFRQFFQVAEATPQRTIL